MNRSEDRRSPSHDREKDAGNLNRDQDDDGLHQAGFLKAIAESPGAAHLVADAERFLYVGPGFVSLTGYSSAELLAMKPGRLFAHEWSCPAPTADAPAVDDESSLIPPLPKGGWGGFWDKLQQSADGEDTAKGRGFAPLRFETRITTKAGAEKWVAVTASPTEHAKKPALLGSAVDITAYKYREEALRRSEMRYRKVFEFAPDCLIIHDSEGRAIDANPEALRLFGGSSRDETAILLTVPTTWHEDDRARFPEIREETFKRGEWRGEHKAHIKGGQVFDFDTRVKVAHIGGETVVIAMSRDISERKRMEERIRNALLEKETLLREIHHRVKNNMQIISTLLKLQLRNTDDEKARALFRESQNRILSMAMIHEKLYQSEGLHKINLNEYIGDLAAEVFASFGADFDTIALHMDIEDIALGMDAAIPCGLIVIELLSNALKYAFPENHRGEIRIGLRAIDHNRFELTVSDNGVGLPPHVDISRLKSLGLRLVSDLARYELQGEMELMREGGTTVRIRFQERRKSREKEHA